MKAHSSWSDSSNEKRPPSLPLLQSQSQKPAVQPYQHLEPEPLLFSWTSSVSFRHCGKHLNSSQQQFTVRTERTQGHSFPTIEQDLPKNSPKLHWSSCGRACRKEMSQSRYKKISWRLKSTLTSCELQPIG